MFSQFLQSYPSNPMGNKSLFNKCCWKNFMEIFQPLLHITSKSQLQVHHRLTLPPPQKKPLKLQVNKDFSGRHQQSANHKNKLNSSLLKTQVRKN